MTSVAVGLTLFFFCICYLVQCIEAKPTILWSELFNSPSEYSTVEWSPTPLGVLISNAGEAMFLADSMTGTPIWKSTGAPYGALKVLQNDPSRFYVGQNDAGFAAFSLQTGAPLFNVTSQKGYGMSSLVRSAAAGSELFSADVDYVYSFDWASGAVNWAYDTTDFPGDDVESDVVAGQCGSEKKACAIILSAAHVDGTLGSEVLAVADNAVAFRNPTDHDLSGFYGSLLVMADLVITPSYYGIFATSTVSGETRWNVSTVGNVMYLDAAARRVIGAVGNVVTVVDAGSGATLHSIAFACAATSVPLTKADPGPHAVLLVTTRCGDSQSHAYGVNASSGKVMWSRNYSEITTAQIFGATVIVAELNRVDALSAATGASIGSITFTNKVEFAELLSSRVFIASTATTATPRVPRNVTIHAVEL